MFKTLFLVSAIFLLMSHAALAEGDVVAGEKVAQRCVSCHSIADTTNKKGPTLRGIIGRPAASVAGFEYSDGLKAFGATGAIWDEATLDKFLVDTYGFVKGIRMVIPGQARNRTGRSHCIS